MEKESALKALENHGVIAFATETVMGLGVFYDDFEAYTKLNKIKRRPEDKPYTMMLGDVTEIQKYATFDGKFAKIIDNLMPGPVTVLLKSKGCVPGYVTHETGIIGIRVPGSEELCELLKFFKKPLLVPSANRSGEKPALNSQEVNDIFGDEVDYIIDGESGHELPSTIIDLTGEKFKILRQGSIKEEDILKVLEG